jgi:hypothetical protein
MIINNVSGILTRRVAVIKLSVQSLCSQREPRAWHAVASYCQSPLLKQKNDHNAGTGRNELTEREVYQPLLRQPIDLQQCPASETVSLLRDITGRILSMACSSIAECCAIYAMKQWSAAVSVNPTASKSACTLVLPVIPIQADKTNTTCEQLFRGHVKDTQKVAEHHTLGLGIS